MKLISGEKMKNKVCLITGGNSGIGRETALGIAKKGLTVVIVSRDYLKGKEAIEFIKRESGNKKVGLIAADLSSRKQIYKISEEFRKKYKRLDILINNAAAVMQNRVLTEDGIEYQLAVNHLAPFLLTSIMADLLIDSAPSRIINVSSQTHVSASIDFNDLNSSVNYHPAAVYSMTKLMNILFTYKLASKLQGTGVTANCLHPGVVSTKLLLDYQGNSGLKSFFSKLRNDSAERGARTSIYLALSSDADGVTGKYFTDMKQKESSPMSYDKKLADKLWEVSSRLTGILSQSEIV
jgi:NAD(P)-dependent dehydrogenase (short-subunit alcohol dehydrogenase family)